MKIKAIEIDNVPEIKEPIMDYEKNNDKLYIFAKQRKYSINYNLENEKKVFKLLKDSISLFEKELNYNIKEIKAFNKILLVTVLYALLFIVLGVFLSSFIPLIFTAPSLIFGARCINNLKGLKIENENLSYDLYVQNSNLRNREFELNKNCTIEIENPKQEYENNSYHFDENGIEDVKRKSKSKRKSLSLF